VGFTTVKAVCLLYPSFQTGVPNQKPSNTLIQQFIDDVADIITAILLRRFNESISSVGSLNAWLVSLGLPDISWYPGLPVNANDIVVDANDPMNAQQAQGAGTTGTTAPQFNLIYGGATTDNNIVWKNIGQTRQLGLLERGNRYGAASQLGAVLGSLSGLASARDLAKEYTKSDWEPFKQELNAEDKQGKPKAYGAFDFLFDPLSNVQTPRPLLEGIAGGDQQIGVAADLEGLGAFFSKWGIDFGRKSRGYPTPWNINN